MAELELGNPWIFTVAVVVTWVLVWGITEVVFLDGDPTSAVITGAVSGLAFALFYVILSTQIET
jgi:uncharacterized MnhB-related membrane protein